MNNFEAQLYGAFARMDAKSNILNNERRNRTMITITNNFTGKVTSVNPSLPMTRRKADAIRARLCLPSCLSGDDLGARGPQVDGYSDLLNRAQAAIMSGDIR